MCAVGIGSLFLIFPGKHGQDKTASTLRSRIIYCSSLIIPLFQFMNNNYRFKSKKHLQCVQTSFFIHYTRTHSRTRNNLRLNNGSLSGHVWIIGNTPPAVFRNDCRCLLSFFGISVIIIINIAIILLLFTVTRWKY